MATSEEIAVLEALMAQGESLESRPGVCTPRFRSQLRLVDRKNRLLLLGCSADEAANRALLALPRAELQVEWGEWWIAFTAGNPTPFLHQGTEAIRLEFPNAVDIRRRRLYQRTADPLPPLRCVDYVGDTVAFEFTVTDVSQGGVALRVDFAGDELEPGMVLSACRLECAGREPAIVDLKVQHTRSATLPSGSRVAGVGCRFVNLSPAAMALIAEYTDAKPSARQ